MFFPLMMDFVGKEFQKTPAAECEYRQFNFLVQAAKVKASIQCCP
jgi:hypothetical protein